MKHTARVCKQCENPLTGSLLRVFCSIKCRSRNKHLRLYQPVTHAVVCVDCHRQFTTSRKHGPSAKVYCSAVCRRRQRNKRVTSTAKGREYMRNANKVHRERNKDNPVYLEKRRARDRKRHNGLRHDAIKAYGGYSCTCPHGSSVCGPHPQEFLAIDHIDGLNGVERQPHLTQWLKNNGYPPGYRVLCHNCNLARDSYGFCPHAR